VFFRYQRKIHNDPASRWPESGFKRFLCDGLDRSTQKVSGKTKKLGSYHHCYRLDGKLVAVGVLDLLPHAVSSVYLFYDPEYSHFDWGKLSALREIALAKESSYQYYYMGFYIHSCIKMRYKANYKPSYLLDPETYDWNLFDEGYRHKLDKRKFVSPSKDVQHTTAEPPSDTVETTGLSSKEASKGDATQSRRGKFADDQDLELDEEDSDVEDADIPEGSMFDFDIPGVLSRGETAKLDLDHWKLVVRNTLVDLEVRWKPTARECLLTIV
jgi:arginyl-tRNA---protein transferase